ncbi:hypothetical protein [Geomonas propionica]|uniref:Uncharacterized protein n=1 Tax=Geomonas propionica TaxID=2798582 RepID=A0ABS0YVG4_9BACT|nr:hypothetical protein [Geomonas propionica]MBJ6801958.1 hypothetical protein [Geomonas propionica]
MKKENLEVLLTELNRKLDLVIGAQERLRSEIRAWNRKMCNRDGRDDGLTLEQRLDLYDPQRHAGEAMVASKP